MSHPSSQPAARAAAVSTPADALRFAVLDSPNAAFPVLVERWKTIEALGFDSLLLPDHTADFTDLDSPWHDGWIAVAAAACHTTRIRVGTLVSNPILRHPAILAKQAAALDHLSNGGGWTSASAPESLRLITRRWAQTTGRMTNGSGVLANT